MESFGAVYIDEYIQENTKANSYCTEWTGETDPQGRGVVHYFGLPMTVQAYRWLRKHNTIPEGKRPDPSCGLPSCSTLSHLRLVPEDTLPPRLPDDGELRCQYPTCSRFWQGNRWGFCSIHNEWWKKTRPRRSHRDFPDDGGRTFEFNTRKLEDGCVVWTGDLDEYGRGVMRHPGETTPAADYVWMTTYYPLFFGPVVVAICGKPSCCKPSHLKLVEPDHPLVTDIRGARSYPRFDPKSIRVPEDTPLELFTLRYQSIDLTKG